jgi:hypothetical protein
MKIINWLLLALLLSLTFACEECDTDGDNEGTFHLNPKGPTTTRLKHYATVKNTDYIALHKAGFRPYWLGHTAPLRKTEESFDLNSFSDISRIIMYTTSRTDYISPLSFNVNGNPAPLVSIGHANGKCWTGYDLVAYRAEFSAQDLVDGFLNVTDIPSNSLVNGISVLVFYNDGDDSNNRDIRVYNGNDINFPETTLVFFNVKDFHINERSDAIAEYHISDVEWRSSEWFGNLYLNDQLVRSRNVPFNMEITPLKEAMYWDVERIAIPCIGSNNNVETKFARFTRTAPALQASQGSQDCESLIAFVIDRKHGDLPVQTNLP